MFYRLSTTSATDAREVGPLQCIPCVVEIVFRFQRQKCSALGWTFFGLDVPSRCLNLLMTTGNWWGYRRLQAWYGTVNGLGRTGATNTESSYSCRTYAIILNNAKPMAKPEHQLQCPAPVYTAAVLPAAVCAAAAAANRRVSGFNPRKPVAIIMSCEGVCH